MFSRYSGTLEEYTLILVSYSDPTHYNMAGYPYIHGAKSFRSNFTYKTNCIPWEILNGTRK
jgi:hypothetical protein